MARENSQRLQRLGNGWRCRKGPGENNFAERQLWSVSINKRDVDQGVNRAETKRTKADNENNAQPYGRQHTITDQSNGNNMHSNQAQTKSTDNQRIENE